MSISERFVEMMSRPDSASPGIGEGGVWGGVIVRFGGVGEGNLIEGA